MLVEDIQAVALTCVVVATTAYAVRWYLDPINAIATVGGPSFPGLSFFAVVWTPPRDYREVLEEGYRKARHSAFKVRRLGQWLVVVSGRRMVEELRKRPDEELSFPLSVQEALQSQYALEPPLRSDHYHVKVVQEKLGARRLPDIIPVVIDEIPFALREHIAAKENEWTSVPVMPVMQKIVAQTSNRAFVGLPLCRNEDYLAQAIGFAVHVARDAAALLLVPGFMRPLVAPFIRNVKRHTSHAVSRLRPIIEERRRAFAELGEGWNDKPNDVLQLILDKAISKGEGMTTIVQRLLMVDFAAISTTSSTITHVLYHLAEKPDFLTPLRKEIEASISTDGWTPTALGNMWKLDSILRETLRHHGISLLSMQRMAAKDITLSDGTRIPKGTLVFAATHPLHHDGAHIEHADTFDPFRYADVRRAAPTGESLKHRCTSTSPGYIAFGHGTLACPGRYFAVNMLKATLARIILDYDLKLGGDGVRPADVCYGLNIMPAPDGRVLFKKRSEQSLGSV
ncbi:cytochrome P450 [Ganoderma leucocontextum]|nr:cytochrome P450 [Ganoderma leucocontextum]